MNLRLWACAPLLVSLTLLAGNALADNKQDAIEHYRRGVTLFEDKRMADALAEFEQSYALSPAFGTLYNIGQIHMALGHSVDAVKAFETYLAHGGSAVPAERRAGVESELAKLRTRVAQLTIRINQPGAQLRIDGKVVQLSGSDPVRVNAGRHSVEALLDGFKTDVREIDVAGQAQLDVVLTLQPLAREEKPETKRVEDTPKKQPEPVPQESGSPGTAQTAVGYTLGAIGLVGMGVGVILANSGNSKQNDSVTDMEAAASSKNKAGYDAASSSWDEGKSQKNTGYVILGLGGAAALGGVILLLTVPSAKTQQAGVRWTPWVNGTMAGGALQGVW